MSDDDILPSLVSERKQARIDEAYAKIKAAWDRDAGLTDWCYSHGRFEPPAEGDFKVCFECSHIWRTRDEFLADVEVGCREAGVPMDPDLPFCPLCTHDF